MVRKQLLKELLSQETVEERKFFDGITDEERQRRGTAEDWAPKDLIAHNAYWKRIRLDRIQAALAGNSGERIRDIDHQNAAVFAEFEGHSWNEIIAYAESASASLQKQLESLDEEELELEWLAGIPLWRDVIGGGYIHPLSHIAQYYQEHGSQDRAAEITGMLGEPIAALDDSPGWLGTVYYNVACGYALSGAKEEALTELAKALKLNDQLVEWSKQDADLDSLRGDPAYEALYE